MNYFNLCLYNLGIIIKYGVKIMGLVNEYAIKTFNLTKVYGDTEVLSNVNINIKKGEIYGFLGPNGSGKTTTMKLLMGFIKPINGKIEILGKDLEKNLYKILENIGSIIERPIFYENMTAVENMKLHLDYFGYSNENTIEESLKKVNLVNVENKKVKKFSQGMKQRLALARAISTKPEILILDGL
jgi:ABC-2 type transport system ATP-binding protein